MKDNLKKYKIIILFEYVNMHILKYFTLKNTCFNKYLKNHFVSRENWNNNNNNLLSLKIQKTIEVKLKECL